MGRNRDARPLPRGHCPGCERHDVVLLEPRQEGQPWRRKAHAVAGDLQQAGTTRCRYPVRLTPAELPEELCN